MHVDVSFDLLVLGALVTTHAFDDRLKSGDWVIEGVTVLAVPHFDHSDGFFARWVA